MIPDDHFVIRVDLDADPPYCEHAHNNDYAADNPIRTDLPKPLAYFLATHFCGSRKMEKAIEDRTRRSISTAIRNALGLETP